MKSDLQSESEQLRKTQKQISVHSKATYLLNKISPSYTYQWAFIYSTWQDFIFMQVGYLIYSACFPICFSTVWDPKLSSLPLVHA